METILKVGQRGDGFWLREVIFRATQFDIIKDAQISFSDTQFVQYYTLK